MKILGITFCVIYLLLFLKGKIKLNGSANITVIQRAGVCFVISMMLTFFIGLPILGIIYLVSN